MVWTQSFNEREIFRSSHSDERRRRSIDGAFTLSYGALSLFRDSLHSIFSPGIFIHVPVGPLSTKYSQLVHPLVHFDPRLHDAPFAVVSLLIPPRAYRPELQSGEQRHRDTALRLCNVSFHVRVYVGYWSIASTVGTLNRDDSVRSSS